MKGKMIITGLGVLSLTLGALVAPPEASPRGSCDEECNVLNKCASSYVSVRAAYPTSS